MEIKITTKQVLKVLEIISWILFIGLCVDAGGIVFNTLFTLAEITPDAVGNFWKGSDYLSNLYAYDRGHFFVIALLMCIVSVLKAILFYLIVRLFVRKKLDISQPFSVELRQFILKLSYLALGIGLFSESGLNYSAWLAKQGAGTPDLLALDLDGADVWLFMAVILFVIAQIVKRGIEIQNENDLTI